MPRETKTRTREKIRGSLRAWVNPYLAIIAIWILTVVVANLGWIAYEDYSVLGAPFLEEAFKGGAALIIAASLSLRPKTKVSLRNLGLLWGLLVGLMFGIGEGILQDWTLQGVLSGIATHPLWTAAIAVGFCSFLLTGKRSLPIAVYLTAVGAHASWNFGEHYASAVASSIAIFLTFLTISVALLVPLSRKSPSTSSKGSRRNDVVGRKWLMG